MGKDEKIYYGPPLGFEVLETSLGEFIYERLRMLPDNHITHIDAENGESMTKKDFLEGSERVACGLQKIGATTGDVIAVFGENSFNNFKTLTAGILLNATIAPLDPNLKLFELTRILQFYQPKYIFCHEAQSEAIVDALNSNDMADVPIILLDRDTTDNTRLLGFSVVCLPAKETEVKPGDVRDVKKEVAIVMCSSGSTGIPKGVALSHQSLVVMLQKMLNHPMRSALGGLVTMQTSHPFWISGMYSILGSYLGQTHVFLHNLDTETIIAVSRKYKPVFTFMSPSELASIMKYPGLKRDDLASYKMIITGGGPLQKFVIDQFKEKLASPPMVAQFYGFTENAGGVSHYELGVDRLSVGKLDSGIELKIVDPLTEAVLGPGEVGEVRVRHDYQMVKYLGNPEATKEAFDEERFLKTGDLGYMTENEVLYLTGRIKSLIKFRNMQISPNEIEDLLIGLDGVQDVGVDGIPHPEDQYHPLALVVKSPSSTITEEEICNYVKENMSSHNELRAGVIFVESIPRNPHHKLKRNDLRQLAQKLHAERNQKKINYTAMC